MRILQLRRELIATSLGRVREQARKQRHGGACRQAPSGRDACVLAPQRGPNVQAIAEAGRSDKQRESRGVHFVRSVGGRSERASMQVKGEKHRTV